MDAADTWNDKILDYEIERSDRACFSQWTWEAWNDKILDYEIESSRYLIASWAKRKTWNDKILDYEIESGCLYALNFGCVNLKR